jgi:hypothetical protein
MNKILTSFLGSAGTRILAGSTILVLAFSAGIGLNVFKRATVFGAPPIPLTSVAHDPTLTGSGTTSSPLGVSTGGIGTGQLANGAVTLPKLSIPGGIGTGLLADGAVTLPKLSILGSPVIGNVVGYNGSGLAWQAASIVVGGGGPQIVDSVGHSYPLQFGGPNPGSGALWQTAGETFIIPLLLNSVADTSIFAHLVYASSDCSGPGFLTGINGVDPANLVIQSPLSTYYNSKTTLYYAMGAAQQVTTNSISNGIVCSPGFGLTQSVYSVGTADLSSAFVPPFHVQLN